MISEVRFISVKVNVQNWSHSTEQLRSLMFCFTASYATHEYISVWSEFSTLQATIDHIFQYIHQAPLFYQQIYPSYISLPKCPKTISARAFPNTQNK